MALFLQKDLNSDKANGTSQAIPRKSMELFIEPVAKGADEM